MDDDLLRLLESLELERFKSNFEDNEVFTLETLLLLKPAQLAKLGLKLGSRKRLLKKAREVQMLSQMAPPPPILPTRDDIPNDNDDDDDDVVGGDDNGDDGDDNGDDGFIRWDELLIGEELGRGSFAVVRKGLWREKHVAVKIAFGLSTTSPSDELRGFVDEAMLMMKIPEHPNVVHTYGICLESEQPAIVVELAEGSLLDMLCRFRDGQAACLPGGLMDTEETMLSLAIDIAMGMAHLHRNGIIHRDLALRNIMLDGDGRARVGDFGMARLVKGEVDAATTLNTMVPMRWCAPESQGIDGVIYSEHTDVWAFGVTMWELFSCPEIPYGDIKSDYHAFLSICNGRRLDQPENCSVDVYTNMMLPCWKENPEDRPSLHVLSCRIQTLYHHIMGTSPKELLSKSGRLPIPMGGGPKMRDDMQMDDAVAASASSENSTGAPEEATNRVMDPDDGGLDAHDQGSAEAAPQYDADDPDWVSDNLDGIFQHAQFVLKDRKHRLRMYRHCFVAKEAVDMFMAVFGAKTRADACNLGQGLVDHGMISHVVNEGKRFQDRYHFYRISKLWDQRSADQVDNDDDDDDDDDGSGGGGVSTSTTVSVEEGISSMIDMALDDPSNVSMYLHRRTISKNGEEFVSGEKAEETFFKLASMLVEGKECVQNMTKAAELFGKAAEKDHVAAKFNLAIMHARGHGVPQSFSRAIILFHDASQLGCKRVMLLAGLMVAEHAKSHPEKVQSRTMALEAFQEALSGEHSSNVHQYFDTSMRILKELADMFPDHAWLIRDALPTAAPLIIGALIQTCSHFGESEEGFQWDEPWYRAVPISLNPRPGEETRYGVIPDFSRNQQPTQRYGHIPDFSRKKNDPISLYSGLKLSQSSVSVEFDHAIAVGFMGEVFLGVTRECRTGSMKSNDTNRADDRHWSVPERTSLASSVHGGSARRRVQIGHRRSIPRKHNESSHGVRRHHATIGYVDDMVKVDVGERKCIIKLVQSQQNSQKMLGRDAPTFLERTISTLNYFHGTMSRYDAERTLQSHSVGSFLVRFDLSREHLVFSFKAEKDQVRHSRLQWNESSGHFTGKGTRYPNIQSILDQYRTLLLRPVKSDTQPRDHSPPKLPLASFGSSRSLVIGNRPLVQRSSKDRSMIPHRSQSEERVTRSGITKEKPLAFAHHRGEWGRWRVHAWKKKSILNVRLRAAVEIASMEFIHHFLPSKMKNSIILSQYGVVQTRKCAAIVMEYAQYGPLRKWITSTEDVARSPSFPWTLATKLRILHQIADGVKCLHAGVNNFKHILPETIWSGGLIHGDLHSGNIMVTNVSPFTIKFTNFGLAKLLAGDVSSGIDARHGEGYSMMAGERTPAKDVFDMAVVMWEILCEIDVSKVSVAINERPPFPAGLPVALTSMIDKCLQRDPRQRPTIVEVCSAIESISSS